jgi:cytochrome c553
MKTLHIIYCALTVVSLTAAAPALAAGNAEAGKAKAASCVACHGEGGAKPIMPIYPILAGQHADYIVKAIKDYKTGARKDPVMAGMAATIADADIANIAAYFASQKGLAVPSVKK